MKNYYNQKGISAPKITWVVASIVIVVLIITSVFILGKGKEKKSVLSPPTYQEVQTDGLAWRVISVKDHGNTLLGSKSNHPETTKDKVSSGRFIEVEVIVENKGEDWASLLPPNLIDDQGAQLRDISYELKEWVPEDKAPFLLGNFRPNIPVNLIFFYEVRAEAVNFKLEVRTRTSSQLINLGM